MTMRGGQAHVQRFWHTLLDKIVKGALTHLRNRRDDPTFRIYPATAPASANYSC